MLHFSAIWFLYNHPRSMICTLSSFCLMCIANISVMYIKGAIKDGDEIRLSCDNWREELNSAILISEEPNKNFRCPQINLSLSSKKESWHKLFSYHKPGVIFQDLYDVGGCTHSFGMSYITSIVTGLLANNNLR